MDFRHVLFKKNIVACAKSRAHPQIVNLGDRKAPYFVILKKPFFHGQ